MQNAVDLDTGDGSSPKGREKHSTDGVTEGRSESSLQRLTHELGVGIGAAFGLNLQTLRFNQLTPILLHMASSQLAMLKTFNPSTKKNENRIGDVQQPDALTGFIQERGECILLRVELDYLLLLNG